MQEIKEFAPVLIPTLNRYEHFKRCLESLERCTWAEKTDVYVALDFPPSDKYVEGWKKINSYLKEKEQSNGFKKLIVYRRKENYFFSGKGNLATAIKDLPEGTGCYIVSEDDNEFSPCFLDYMNKALTRYWDNDRVSSVSGYSDVCCYNQEGHDTYFCYANSAWGLGMWSHKEKEIRNILDTNDYLEINIKDIRKGLAFFKRFPARFGMLIQMLKKGKDWEDVKRSSINYFTGKYQLRPTVSLCRNWGYDGSGEHCNKNSEYSKQYISNSKLFEFNFDPAGPNSKACKMLYKYNGLPENIFKRFCVKVICLCLYIHYLMHKQ